MTIGQKYKIKEYVFMILGCLLTALGIVEFATPAKIANGGMSGIAIIVYHLTGFDTGSFIFIFSIPLFIAGIWIFGKQYGLKSIFCTLVLSIFTTMFNYLLGTDGFLDFSKDNSYLLAAIFGGVLIGVGVGLTMKSGANTGGTDILAQITAKYTKMSLGTALFIVDFIIVLAGGIAFGIESILYAIITIYITGVVVDKTVTGFGKDYTYTVYIISENKGNIQKAIIEELDHSGTILEAKGMFSGNNRPVIMTVVPKYKLSKLTAIVHVCDPKAFMIVQETHQVLGEGYTSLEDAVWANKANITDL